MFVGIFFWGSISKCCKYLGSVDGFGSDGNERGVLAVVRENKFVFETFFLLCF